MTPQLKDLVTNYLPDIVWVDGDYLDSWKYWKSDEMIAWLYNERFKKFLHMSSS